MKGNRIVMALGALLVMQGANIVAMQPSINMALLIQEAKAIASRLEVPMDIINVSEQTVKDTLNKVLAYIPATVETGRIRQDLTTIVQKRFNISLSDEELAQLQKGIIPTRVRIAMQSAIPSLVKGVEIVEFHLKNVGTAIYLTDNVAFPAVQPYLSLELKEAVEKGIAFARANQRDIQQVANQMLAYTAILKTALNSLQNLNDAQFKSKLVEMATTVKDRAVPLFNSTIKPFVIKNQTVLFDTLMLFKGIRFTEADVAKVTNALHALAQGRAF